MKYVFWMTGDYKSHADDKFDPSALPVIKNINYRDVVAENVNMGEFGRDIGRSIHGYLYFECEDWIVEEA